MERYDTNQPTTKSVKTVSKKKSPSKKSSGTAAIKMVEDDHDEMLEAEVQSSDFTSEVEDSAPERKTDKPQRAKKKVEAPAGDAMSLGDIKKAAAFANSVGGLDKAVALLQILKVAKEVQ
jgi:hypothetical protein